MLFKFNSFRSKNNDSVSAPSFDESDNLTEQTEENQAINSSSSIRLFKKNSSFYSGPETMYENEAWAPVKSTGLFHRRWATPEEQSSSSTEAQ